MMFVGRTVWEVHQGREGDFIGFCRRGSEIHRRLGATNVALIAHNTGPGHLMTYVLQFENGAGYGTFVDALPSDSECSPWDKSSLPTRLPESSVRTLAPTCFRRCLVGH